MQPDNVVPRSLDVLDDRIARLEAELADLSSDGGAENSDDDDDDDSDEAEPEPQPPPAKKQKPEKPPREGKASSSSEPMSLYCQVCGVSVNSELMMEEHLAGIKHKDLVKANVAKAEGRYCEVCER